MAGSVGRAVASDSRGPQFDSSHRGKFILNIYCQLYWKAKELEKEVGLDPSFKTNKLSWKFLDWKVPPDELEETASSFVLRKRRRPHLQRPRKASLLTLAYVVYSVTRSELLGNKFSYKSSPNIWVNVWAIIQLSFKTLFGYFLGNLWRNWDTFYSIINISQGCLSSMKHDSLVVAD